MMLYKTEAEKAFFEDVREKKKTASGVHHKTGKNGYVGTMRFPSDLMSRKEKYNYRKAGKVMTTNIYDEIISIGEFENLETHEQRNRMAYWRMKFTNKDIMKGLRIANNRYYAIVKELGLPKAERTYSDKPKKPRQPRQATAAILAAPVAKELEPVQEIIINGLSLVYNGTFSAEQLQQSLSKFIGLLEGETDQFYIELKIMQKGENE
jgi:hypothetical protein